MTTTGMTPEQRRRNILTALLLAGFVAFMFLSSFPFWKGLFEMMSSGAL